MAANFELKARCTDLALTRERARGIATRWLGLDHQTDTYFKTAAGRFKLRESSLSGAQLVPYLRPDAPHARRSDYVVIPFSGLGATLEKIKTNRAQIKRMLKAEIEALRFIHANAAGTTEVIRKRFNMDEKLARESYDAVVNSFSRDGRVPLDGVDILLQIEKDAKVIPTTVTPQMIVDPSLVEEALKELGSR